MSQREDRYKRLAYIALREFPDVVVGTEIVEGKLRIFVADESFIDIWFSSEADIGRGLVRSVLGMKVQASTLVP